jgi:hypothetical protein
MKYDDSRVTILMPRGKNGASYAFVEIQQRGGGDGGEEERKKEREERS